MAPKSPSLTPHFVIVGPTQSGKKSFLINWAQLKKDEVDSPANTHGFYNDQSISKESTNNQAKYWVIEKLDLIPMIGNKMFRQTPVIIILVDGLNMVRLDKTLETFIAEIRKGNKNIAIGLIGNKRDLLTNENLVKGNDKRLKNAAYDQHIEYFGFISAEQDDLPRNELLMQMQLAPAKKLIRDVYASTSAKNKSAKKFVRDYDMDLLGSILKDLEQDTKHFTVARLERTKSVIYKAQCERQKQERRKRRLKVFFGAIFLSPFSLFKTVPWYKNRNHDSKKIFSGTGRDYQRAKSIRTLLKEDEEKVAPQQTAPVTTPPTPTEVDKQPCKRYHSIPMNPNDQKLTNTAGELKKVKPSRKNTNEMKKRDKIFMTIGQYKEFKLLAALGREKERCSKKRKNLRESEQWDKTQFTEEKRKGVREQLNQIKMESSKRITIANTRFFTI